MRNGTLGLLFFLVALFAMVAMGRYYVLGVLMASAALLVFGLRVGDRWIALAGGVSSAIFMAAVALIGGAM